MSAYLRFINGAKKAGGIKGAVGATVDAGVKLGDRLMGRSATILRERAEGARRVIEGSSQKYSALQGTTNNRYVNKVRGLANREAVKSRNTRLAVGGALGAGAILHKATTPPESDNYANFQDYQG